MKNYLLLVFLFILIACSTENSTTSLQREESTSLESIPSPLPLETAVSPPTDTPPTSEPTDIPPITEPTISLTGLLYQSNGALWRVSEGGTPEKIISGIPATGKLSPDQTQILYNENDDLYLYDLTTRLGHALTQTPDVFERGYWWPNQSATIAYNFIPEDQLGPWSGYLGLLYLTSGTQTILDDERGSNSSPALSPDGTTIAIGTGDDIWLYDVTTGVWSLLDLEAFGMTEELRVSSPAWSPDGQKLALIFNHHEEDYLAIGTLILDFEKQINTRLRSYEPLGGGGWQPRAEWSATGEWLVLTYYAEMPDSRVSVWLTSVDGSQTHPLDNTHSYLWHPTEDIMIFARELPDNNGHQYHLIEAGSWQETAVDIPTDEHFYLVDWVTSG